MSAAPHRSDAIRRAPGKGSAEAPLATYCGRKRPRSWTPQLGGKRPLA